ncbi:MAG: hypothetical protein GY816_19630 [Cytophagales bacterium]|nr:hypothetical protein [Cytophagales bacterium]
MKKNTLLTCVLIGFVFASKAQSTRDDEAKPSTPVYQASKSKKKLSFSMLFKSKKTNSQKLPYEQKEEFEKRMKAVAKEKSKEARIASKPQYSNKSYFGHKREPKKRAVGKKKYCKICEFAH